VLVHSVYFWLDNGLGEEDKASFLQDLEALRGIENLGGVYIGKPGPTVRPAVDRTYDFALTVLMKDMTVHDHYQRHPLHKEFLAKNSTRWTKVVIYDSLVSHTP